MFLKANSLRVTIIPESVDLLTKGKLHLRPGVDAIGEIDSGVIGLQELNFVYFNFCEAKGLKIIFHVNSFGEDSD